MATVYAVKDRVIGEKVSVDELEGRGIDIEFQYRNAKIYYDKNDCNFGKITHILIYEAEGDDFTGQYI